MNMSNKSNWMRSPWIRRQQKKVHVAQCQCTWCVADRSERLVLWTQRVMAWLTLAGMLTLAWWIVSVLRGSL